MSRKRPGKAELETRSEFRHQLRRFERFGEAAAQREGITFTQYLLLLHIKGMPGRAWALVGELAERLLLEHHSVVGLVTRTEGLGLVERRRSAEDARQVEVHLTRAGDRVVGSIAAAHDEQMGELLRHLQKVMRQTRSRA